MRSNRQLAAIGALVSLLAAAPSQAKVSLSFGLYTSNKPTAMVKQFRPVLDAVERSMEADLGEPVDIRIQVAKNYSQGIEHLASGKVDFSRFGPASYIEAKRANSGLRILAMEREGAEKVFYGVIAVAKDSPIQTVEDLHGRSFAFGSDQSTIGRYLSQQYLRRHGIYADDLSRYDYLSRHDKVGTAVGAGHFEAGALNETTFNALVEDGVPIRELARFPNVTKPWIAREGLPERLFAALRDALMRLDEPAALAALEKDGFLEGDDSDYAEIRASIEHNSAFFEKPADAVAVESAPEPAPEPATAPPDTQAVARAATVEGVGEGSDVAEPSAVAGAPADSFEGEAQVTGDAGDASVGGEPSGADTAPDTAPVLASPAAESGPGPGAADLPAASEPESEPGDSAPHAAPLASPIVDGESWSAPEPRAEPSATIENPSPRPAG